MKEACFYEQTNFNTVKCQLCPHHCIIHDGKVGICGVRKNINGVLYAVNYGIVSSAALDPIEKKPLYNYMPGSKIFSIGSIGCNLHCSFCQNWQIARAGVEQVGNYEPQYDPQDIIDKALDLVPYGNIGIAYTYNEPTVWYEFMKDIAVLAQQKGLKNVVVTNGYISSEPLQELLPYIDAFNVDLKGYNQDFYTRLTKSTFQPVLETLQQIDKAGKHLEIAYLVIPGENDDPRQFEEMIGWLCSHLNNTFSLHINRYFPCYKLKTPATPVETLHQLADIARKKIEHVYIGNVH